MRAAASGDGEAYRRFLAAVAPPLRGIAAIRCRGLGLPDSEAEDIVQEVLLAIHLKRGTWDSSRLVGPWIAAIVRNKMIDALRRRGRHVSVPIEDVVDFLAAEAPPETLSAREIDGLLQRLKAQQKDVVRAISLDGRSIRETAARLEMTEGAVRVTLHRALKTLARLYRGQPS